MKSAAIVKVDTATGDAPEQTTTVATVPATRVQVAPHVVRYEDAPAPVPESKDTIALGHGATTLRLTKEEDAILGQPIADNDVTIRPDGIAYLSHAKLRRIMNDALGRGQWCMVPQGEPQLDKALNRIHRSYHLFARGCFLKEAMGEQEYYPNSPTMSYADALEGAESNALTRCCKALGIGLELWDRMWIESWKDRMAVSVFVAKRNGERKREWRRKDQKPLPGEDAKGASEGNDQRAMVARPSVAPARTTSRKPMDANRRAVDISDVVDPGPKPPSADHPDAADVTEEQVTSKSGTPITVHIHKEYDQNQHVSRPKLGRMVVMALIRAAEVEKLKGHEASVWAHAKLTELAGQLGHEHYSLIPYRGEDYDQICNALAERS